MDEATVLKECERAALATKCYVCPDCRGTRFVLLAESSELGNVMCAECGQRLRLWITTAHDLRPLWVRLLFGWL